MKGRIIVAGGNPERGLLYGIQIEGGTSVFPARTDKVDIRRLDPGNEVDFVTLPDDDQAVIINPPPTIGGGISDLR